MKPSRLMVALPAIALLLAAPLSAGTFSGDGDGDGQTRSAAVIVEEIDAVEMPSYDRSRAEEEGYVEAFIEERNVAQKTQATLILELYRADPGHEKVIALMPRRWSVLMAEPTELYAELDLIMEKDAGSPLAIEALYYKGLASGRAGDIDVLASAADAFLEIAPDDDRGARLLSTLAGAHESGSDEQRAAYERIIASFPESKTAGYTQGKLRQLDGVGQPFEVSFEDAISGRTVDMRGLNGQVVVVDFWATWCGPCIAEMPHMKELYAEYHDQGVEFLGISLDNPEERGGLTALKEYVAENEVPWPQYYQGKGWEGDFSMSWGINSIPALFIVDKHGVLRSVSARGELETMIPELLAEG